MEAAIPVPVPNFPAPQAEQVDTVSPEPVLYVPAAQMEHVETPVAEL